MSTSRQPPGDSPDHELTVLVTDYQATREDDRQSLIREVAVVSAGIAIFAAFYYLATGEAQFLARYPLLAATLPLAPYLIAQAHVVHSVEGVLRGYYMRSLEHAIQERVDIRSALGSGIRLPAMGFLTALLHSNRYAAPQVRLTYLFGWASVVALFGGSAILAISTIANVVDRVVVYAVYSALTGFLVWVWFSTVRKRNRRFYLALYAKYPRIVSERLDTDVPSTSSLIDNLSGLAYLLMPRVSDLIKIPIFVLAWIISIVSFSIVQGFSFDEILYSAGLAGVYLLVFEYLIYQGRYQWNDLRNIGQDRSHVSTEQRRRLPVGWERRSLCVLILRVLVAAYLIHLVFRGSPLLVPAYVVAVIPFVIAIPYELARKMSDERPPDESRIRLVHWVVYVLVGLGFGVRIVMGVLIGAYSQVDWALLVALLVAYSLVGSASIVSILAIEAAVASKEGDDDAKRSHAMPLLRYIRPVLPAGKFDIRSEPLLRRRDPVRSPWFILHMAAVLSTSIISLWVARAFPPRKPIELIFDLFFVFAWLSLAAVIKYFDALTGAFLVSIVTAVAMMAAGVTVGPLASAALLIVAGAILTNIWDRMSSHDEFVLGARQVVKQIVASVIRLARAVVRLTFTDSTAVLLFGSSVAKSRSYAPDDWTG